MKTKILAKNLKEIVWSKIFIIFILLFHIVGCEDDLIPKPEPKPVVVEPTLTVSLSPDDTVIYKDSVTISWTSNLAKLTLNETTYDAMLSVTINGVKEPSAKEGKITYKNVMENKVFKFHGISSDGKTIDKEYKVVVGPNPNALRDDSLCLNICWKIDSILYWDKSDNIWIKANPPEEILSEKWIYYFDGKYKGSLGAAGTWEWSGKDAIKVNGSNDAIAKYYFPDRNHLVKSYDNDTYIIYYTGYSI